MLSVGLLLLGVHLACAGKHSLKYFYTAVSGDIDFPEFTSVGLVDEGQFIYFDSNTKEAVPKTEWIKQNVGEDYWSRQTQIAIGEHQSFKNNIQILKERFNQTQGVHTVQVMYGCEWDDQTGETDAFNQYGYDGEDFLSLDMKEKRYISPVQQGFPTVQKWNNDRAYLEGRKHYLNTVCFVWLQKYLQYGKSSLQKTVSPQVSLLQKSSSSPVSCHATGFYPSGVTITWMRNGQEHHEDVDLGELLPNEDGTFQKTSTISVTPEEWKNNKFICVVEHQGETILVNEIRTNSKVSSVSVPMGIIVGAAAVLLIVIGVTGFLVYQMKKVSKPVSGSDNSFPEKHKDQTSLESGTEHGRGSYESIDSDSSVNSSDSTTALIRRDTTHEKSESE